MQRRQHGKEFKAHALLKNRERGERTQQSVADELNVSLGTLKGWVKDCARRAGASPHGAMPLPGERAADLWDGAQRLQALCESHRLADEALHAWCRQKGLFAHQLTAWRQAFCLSDQASSAQQHKALRALQGEHDQLQREMRRKDKALAEAAALLVLQKKFRALWADEA